ncbi:TPA: hypothetical protein NDT77_004001 [Klebsiella pneumoniae]|uniref:hypothetical protein n=1 Tax=Klebsiella pneumoniae TaxID=573 RepID=UPI0013D6F196|nr:hypothetical protein [Klebsiella pneumoniae]USC55765.1 hypothetical protein NE241_20135 [Klebsiella pneumoniae]USC58519.1 hypothetical protein NE241_12980 [Klebsiella pneumoniae]HBY1559747.1 hypothetical protein [Klebsiella pneumoniae]HCD6206270.1 hypothetical protein [Klebsiella pneumoniae]
MNTLPINNPVLMGPINRLLRGGLQVIDINTRFRRPIVEVDRPFEAWRGREVEITERKDGKSSQVKMLIWRGMHVIWR